MKKNEKIAVESAKYVREVNNSTITELKADPAFEELARLIQIYQVVYDKSEYMETRIKVKETVLKRNREYDDWLHYLQGNRCSADPLVFAAVAQLLSVVDVFPKSIRWCNYYLSSGLLNRMMQLLESDEMKAHLKAAKCESYCQNLTTTMAELKSLEIRKNELSVDQGKESAAYLRPLILRGISDFSRFVRFRASTNKKEEYLLLAAKLENIRREINKSGRSKPTNSAPTSTPDASVDAEGGSDSGTQHAV